MCRLQSIAMRDYQESVTTGQTDGQTDAGQSDPYVPLCFAGDCLLETLILAQHTQNNENIKIFWKVSLLTLIYDLFVL